MAKKTGKKPAKKTAKTSAKKAGGKKAAKKSGVKKSGSKKGSKKASMGPVPVKTGKGATPAEVGMGVVAMIRDRSGDQAIWDKWFSPKFVSIEGGMGQAWHGRKAVQAKCDWWLGAHTVHSLEAEGPYVGATGFAVRYTIDAEDNATGNRFKGEEVGFYTVKNGKVVQEEFLGKAM